MQSAIEQLARQIGGQLSERLEGLLPGATPAMRRDIEDHLHALLQSALGKMQLVTREEFDVQTAVLQRTREKLEALEKTLAALQADPPAEPQTKQAQSTGRHDG